MDGLTISSGNEMLRTGRTASEVRTHQLKQDGLDQASGETSSTSFADTLKNAVGSVNDLQHQSDVQMQKLATGETKNIPEVMISVEKANVAFKLLMQVRNKVIDAYQEIMKMQV
jgi:flagellar hook-basal body complex protein FliE